MVDFTYTSYSITNFGLRKVYIMTQETSFNKSILTYFEFLTKSKAIVRRYLKVARKQYK